MAAKRSVIVRTGTRFRSRIQTPSGHGHVPRYRNMIATVGGKKTAFRHVRRRYERYRKKGIRIRLYRGDGVEITDWGDTDGGGDILTFLALRNSEDDWIEQTVEYNEDTRYWELSVDNKEDEDPKGYWIVWQCVNGRLGNYPYRYFPVWDAVEAVSNLRQDEDLVKSGDLIDIIPYFDYDNQNDPVEYCYGFNLCFSESSQKRIIASSSVDYYVRYYMPGTPGGPGWTLSCSEFNYLVPITGEVPETSAFASAVINVQMPEAVAIEIKSKLGDGPGKWDNFNAQFPSISVGEGGVSTDTFIVDFIKNEGASYYCLANVFNNLIPYTLDFG